MRKIIKYFVLVVFFIAYDNEISNAQNTSQNQVNQIEVNKITEVAVAFMKAYSKHDQAVMDSFIASKSEFKNKARQQIWDKWQGRENLVFDRVVNQFARINGENALARITFDLREINLGDEETLNPFSLDFTLIKEGKNWKIFNAGDSARLLVENLQAAEFEQSLLEIIRDEKAFLNSYELWDILNYLKNNVGQDKNRILEIFEMLEPQIEEQKYRKVFLFEQGWQLINSGNLSPVNEKDLARAEKSFLESISLSQNSKNDLSYASSLIGLGGVYLKKKMETEAAQVIDKGLNIFLSKLNLTDKQLTWFRNAGNIYFNQKKYEQAHKYYEQGEKIAEKSNHIPWLAVFIKDLGDCDWYAEKYPEALQQYQKLAIILERPEEKEGFLNGAERINLPTIYATIANTLEKLNRKSEAQPLFEKSCSLTYATNSPQDLKFTCNSLIEYYFRNNSDQKAVESFNKLSEKLFELKAETELIDQLKDFVLIFGIEKGKHSQAEKIVEYWSEKLSPEKRKDIYQIQMSLYMNNYKWSLLQAVCQKIIDSEYSTNEDKLSASIGMATAYASQLQREEGLKWVNKAKIFANETNDKVSIASVKILEMFILDEKGSQNISQLQKFIQENSDNDFLVASANYYLGTSYFSLAEDDYKANSELVKKGIDALQKSLEIYNRPENNYKAAALPVYFTLAVIYKETDDFQLALENIKKARAIAAETETNFMQSQLDLFEAEIQNALGDFPKAKECFKNGLPGLDTQSKYVGGGIQGQLNFYAVYHSVFQSAVNAELKTNSIDNAVAVVDLAKGRMLRELTQKDNKKGVITATVIKDNKMTDKNLPSKSNISVEQVSKQISSLNLNKDTAILNYFVDEDNIHLFILTSEAKMTSQEVSNQKDSLQESSWRHYTIKYDYLIEYKVKRLQNLLRNNNDSNYRQIAKELYDLLLKPAEKQIDGKSTLIIIPDSFLWRLPFQALVAKDSANPNNAEKEKFVIEKFAVQYAFSLTHYIESEQVKKNRAEQQPKAGIKNVLAIGNSTFGEQIITLKPVPEVPSPFEDKPKKIESIIENGIVRKFTPPRRVQLRSLPGAAIEAKNLLKIYGVNRTDYWLDNNATKNKFIEKASSYKTIHIATHGILDDENSLNSSLVFSNFTLNGQNTIAGKTRKPIIIKQASKQSLYGEEYLLTAQEIFSDLRLNADLVILSACDTANGDVSAGEGLIGLTWAFLHAGATDVVASQWKVDDGKTPELMKEFHQQLQDKKQNNSIPIALQKSVKVLLQNQVYYHPYYWAGFVSIGSP